MILLVNDDHVDNTIKKMFAFVYYGSIDNNRHKTELQRRNRLGTVSKTKVGGVETLILMKLQIPTISIADQDNLTNWPGSILFFKAGLIRDKKDQGKN